MDVALAVLLLWRYFLIAFAVYCAIGRHAHSYGRSLWLGVVVSFGWPVVLPLAGAVFLIAVMNE